MRRRDREPWDAARPERAARDALQRENRARVQEWVRAFAQTEEYVGLHPAAQRALDGVADAVARALAWPDGAVEPSPHALEETTADEVVQLLTTRLPRYVAAERPEHVSAGAVALLIWAARTGRIADRAVEYACRRVRRETMRSGSEHPGASMVLAAVRDGVDPNDLAAVRAHALAAGQDADYVDEMLPPGSPILLADGRWLWRAD